jgi:hypothetical protein
MGSGENDAGGGLATWSTLPLFCSGFVDCSNKWTRGWEVCGMQESEMTCSGDVRYYSCG